VVRIGIEVSNDLSPFTLTDTYAETIPNTSSMGCRRVVNGGKEQLISLRSFSQRRYQNQGNRKENASNRQSTKWSNWLTRKVIHWQIEKSVTYTEIHSFFQP